MIDGIATAACSPYARPILGTRVRRKGLRKLVAASKVFRMGIVVGVRGWLLHRIWVSVN